MNNSDCPTNDYKEGAPQGKCWGNGHYQCKECQHYREDFKRLGQDYIDFAHQVQGQVTILTLNQKQLPPEFNDTVNKEFWNLI